MIDTIAITLPQNHFEILAHEKFNPNTTGFFYPPYIKLGSGFAKSTCNPTQKQKKQYGYLPRLTLMKAVRKSGFDISLKIEFSAPKMLFSNNFDELDEADFEKLCIEIEKKAYQMGVSIKNIDCIKHSEVSMIHYSKNMILTDGSLPYGFIKEFQKADFNKHFDMNHKDYRNSGHASKIHTNSFEAILYDKLIDLQQAKKSEKRSVEQDSYCQLGLFDQKISKKPFEVLRLEVRIGDRKKLKQILEKYGFDASATSLKFLFCKEIAQKVLMQSMQNVDESYPDILCTESKSFEDIWLELRINHPNIKPKQIVEALGYKVFLQKEGVRGLRTLLDPMGEHHWPRVKKLLQGLKLKQTSRPFDKILKDLIDFEKVCLSDYSHLI